MAENKKVEIDVLVNTAGSAKSVSDIKKSLKDLKAAALEFGEGSEGFKKATAAAGQLNDKLADVNGSIKVLSGNTTENLTRSFAGVAQAGVGGFQAVMGAQALFGDKSKELQETMVKLQGVMAFSNGLKEFANIGQAAKDFKLVLLSLIGTKATETTVTEANTVVTTQNVASKEASAIASTALAIQNGIASAATTVLTTITTAFGVASGVAWAIATGGIILLVAAIVGLIVYFDDIKAKVEEFGIAGEIALGLILGPLYLLYEGLKTLGEYFGVLDTETEKSAERRAEAETKYKDKVEENYRKINAAQREADVASGKITQANADRQEAKENFITNFKKAQIDARLAYEKSAGAEEDAEIKKVLDGQIKAISLEYTNKLGEIRKGEKKLADDAVKATEEKNNKIAEKNRSAGEKSKKAKEDEAAKDKQDTDKYNETLLKAYETRLTDEEKILNESNNKKAQLQTQFDNLTNDEKKARQKQFDDEIITINEETRLKIEENDKKAKDKKDAEDAEKLGKLQTFQQTLRDVEIAGMDETAAALAENEDTRLAERKQITDEFNALTQEEQITNKQAFEDAKLKIDQEAADKKLAIEKSTADKQKAIDLAVKNAKIDFVLQGLSIATSLVDTFGKKNEKSAKRAFDINKGLSIASAIVSTYQAANTILAQAALNPATVLFPAQPFIAAGLAIASGLANVAKIASTKFQPGGGGTPPSDTGGGPTPAIPSGGSAVQGGNQAPVGLPTFGLGGQPGIGGASNMLGNGVGGGGQQPVKVFVTETDISSVQGKVNVIQGNSLFGG
jgi:hypothetical protein